jgi:hypothetical protein
MHPKVKATAYWAVFALLVLGLSYPALYALTFAAIIVGGILLSIAGVWAVWLVYSSFAFSWNNGRKDWLTTFFAIAVVAIVSFGWQSIARNGDTAFSYIRAIVFLPLYNNAIEEFVREPYSSNIQNSFLRVRVDQHSRDTLRLAFPYWGGITDNWKATVHDPTHEIAQADGWDKTPENIRELFGGDMYYCWHLFSTFYTCTFT